MKVCQTAVWSKFKPTFQVLARRRGSFGFLLQQRFRTQNINFALLPEVVSTHHCQILGDKLVVGILMFTSEKSTFPVIATLCFRNLVKFSETSWTSLLMIFLLILSFYFHHHPLVVLLIPQRQASCFWWCRMDVDFSWRADGEWRWLCKQHDKLRYLSSLSSWITLIVRSD